MLQYQIEGDDLRHRVSLPCLDPLFLRGQLRDIYDFRPLCPKLRELQYSTASELVMARFSRTSFWVRITKQQLALEKWPYSVR